MDLRWAVPVAVLLLSGCLGDGAHPAPASPAGDVQGGDAQTSSAATTETLDGGRQSRPGSGPGSDAERKPTEPFSWTGETDGGVCVETPLGCAGVTMSGGASHRVPGAKDGAILLTVTWKPVGSGAEELVLRAGDAEARGPSPLTLELRSPHDFEAWVGLPRDSPLVVAPEQQPFDGLAEYR